jgi:hypothetical protein
VEETKRTSSKQKSRRAMWRGNRDRLHFPLSAKHQQQWTKRWMGKQAKSTPIEVKLKLEAVGERRLVFVRLSSEL